VRLERNGREEGQRLKLMFSNPAGSCILGRDESTTMTAECGSTISRVHFRFLYELYIGGIIPTNGTLEQMRGSSKETDISWQGLSKWSAETKKKEIQVIFLRR